MDMKTMTIAQAASELLPYNKPYEQPDIEEMIRHWGLGRARQCDDGRWYRRVGADEVMVDA